MIIKLSSSNAFFTNRCVKLKFILMSFCIEKPLMFIVLHLLIKCLDTKLRTNDLEYLNLLFYVEFY